VLRARRFIFGHVPCTRMMARNGQTDAGKQAKRAADVTLAQLQRW